MVRKTTSREVPSRAYLPRTDGLWDDGMMNDQLVTIYYLVTITITRTRTQSGSGPTSTVHVINDSSLTSQLRNHAPEGVTRSLTTPLGEERREEKPHYV